VTIRINTPNTKHLYEIETVGKEGHKIKIEVEADNRNQAASVARKAGYEVHSVNMIG
jgi:type II secretory pathway component PulF